MRPEILRNHPEEGNSTISMRLGQLWLKQSAKTKTFYREKAKLEKTLHQLAYPTYQYRPKTKQTEKQHVSKEKNSAQASLSTVQSDSGNLLPAQSLSPICASPDFSFSAAFFNDANCQLPAVLDTVVTSDMCADAPVSAEIFVANETGVTVELDHYMYNHDTVPFLDDAEMGGLVEEDDEFVATNFGMEETNCGMKWNKGVLFILMQQQSLDS